MTHFQRLQIWLAGIPTLKRLWETKAGQNTLQCWTDDKTGKIFIVQVYPNDAGFEIWIPLYPLPLELDGVVESLAKYLEQANT